MKKVYLAPQTEAIQMLGENAIMAGSVREKFIPVGDPVSSGKGA